MAWDVEYTDEFGSWWEGLDEDEPAAVDASVSLLGIYGPGLSRPHADHVKGSRHANMKELRTQHKGELYRTLFAFDPRRTAILLIGGNKGRDRRWYDKFVPVADRLYDQHLMEIESEGTNG